MKKRFTDEQIIRILQEAQSSEGNIRGLCRRHNITEQTFFFAGATCTAASRCLTRGGLSSWRPGMPSSNVWRPSNFWSSMG